MQNAQETPIQMVVDFLLMATLESGPMLYLINLKWLSKALYNSTAMNMNVISIKLALYLGFSWLNDECTSCAPSPGGGSLMCGEASARDTTVAFETILRLYFVKKGKIEFLYTKDSTIEKDGWFSGIFQFYIDEEAVLED